MLKKNSSESPREPKDPTLKEALFGFLDATVRWGLFFITALTTWTTADGLVQALYVLGILCTTRSLLRSIVALFRAMLTRL